jgi:hypothetical protein
VKSPLTSGFDLALVEEPDGLLVKLLLGMSVMATLEPFVLFVVADPLHHYAPPECPEINRERGAGSKPCSFDKRLHLAARL